MSGDLRNTRYDVIAVTGHTDRIGSDAYNMALSTRRADAVKSYLKDPAGIPAAKISARGAGEPKVRPITLGNLADGTYSAEDDRIFRCAGATVLQHPHRTFSLA